MSHSAPPVTYPVGASKTEQALFAALAGSTAVALALWGHSWAWQWTRLPAPWWMSLVALAVWVAWWFWRSRHPLQGRLVWAPPDHEADPPGLDRAGDRPVTGHWRWFSPAYRHGVDLARVECVLDLQGSALLRVRTVAGLGLWLFLEQGLAPEHWPGLRRALKAHARPDR
jgi:hypothetical protein